MNITKLVENIHFEKIKMLGCMFLVANIESTNKILTRSDINRLYKFLANHKETLLKKHDCELLEINSVS